MNWCLRKLQNKELNVLISGFRHEVDEICALLCYYAAYSGNSLLMCRDELSIHLQESQNQRRWTLKMGQIGCPKISVRYYHYTIYNIQEERISQELNGLYCSLCYHCYHVTDKVVKEHDTMQIKMIKPHKMLVTKSQDKGPLLSLNVVKQCMHACICTNAHIKQIHK
jgi:hypothetical protein